MNRFPVVTVIVPARDEADDIARCVHAIGAQDYPVNRLEILVVDGASTDGTAQVARDALASYGFHNADVVLNARRTTPTSLNLGLDRAQGEIICRVDARTIIPPTYVRTCVDVLLERTDVAVVGGSQHAVARDRTSLSIGIARALNNRYSMGLSRYRRAGGSGQTDTVYLGAFRTEDLRDVDGWDERLETNQDFELNRRMAKYGLVWFESSLVSGYLPRSSLRALWRQYVRFGRWKVRYWRMTGDRPQPRQIGLLAAPPSVAVVALALWARHPTVSRAAAITASAGAVLLALEVTGADEPEGPAPAHAVAAAAMAVTGLGWVSGVARALVAQGTGGGALRPRR